MGNSESHEEPKPEQRQVVLDPKLTNNRVIIYLWTTQCLKGRRKSGHVAVEVAFGNRRGKQDENTYISLWPVLDLDPEKWPMEKARPTFVRRDRWSLVEDFTGDRLLEKRRPEYIFCFYTLDTTEIMAAFRSFKRNENTAYNRYGEYVQKVKSDHQLDYEGDLAEGKHLIQSCVSLACLALDAGGINRWITKEDKVLASSEGTSEMSTTQSKNSVETFKFIKPSQNVAFFVLEQLVSGYVMSPDVLLGRLKIAKRKEWESDERIRQLGRMTCLTEISEDGNTKDVTISYQLSDIPVIHPTQENRDHPAPVDERTFEWLPIDEKRWFFGLF